MPYKDADKRKEAQRASMAKQRRGSPKPASRGSHAPDNVNPDVNPGKQSPVVPWTGKQAWQDGELVPVRCWHCGDYHASVQLARECTMETALGEMCGRFAGVVDGVWLQV